MKQPVFKRMSIRFYRMNRLGRILLVVYILASATSAALTFITVHNFVIRTTSFQLPGVAIIESDTDAQGQIVVPEIQQPATNLEPWDGSSRVNILLMGLDYRDWSEGQGPARTDTMIVFTFDPATTTAGMLSIPRDLWVDIPGFGHDKINNAYFLGEGSRLPGGGPGLAVKTVEQFLGIPIHYYAQVDFHAFERFIDIIGGVKIWVQSDIRVQLVGEAGTRLIRGGDEVAGRQVLSGAYALAYARARHEGDGDFDRARRQQEVIFAIRQQLLRPDVTALLITDSLQIYQELSSGINTNMTLEEMFKLAFSMKDIEPSTIAQAVIAPGACHDANCIGPDYVTLDTSPDGLSILKPITQNIRLLRDQVFSTGDARSSVAQNAETAQLMQMEGAQLSINNGTNIPGLADSTRVYLESMGFAIASTGTSDVVSGTTIIDYTGNPYTVAFLLELLHISPTHFFSRYDPSSQIDLEVIVGPDWAIPSQ